MRTLLALSLVLVACSSPPAPAPAEDGAFLLDRATRWSLDSVHAIAVDAGGVAWAATSQGLHRLEDETWRLDRALQVAALVVVRGEVLAVDAEGELPGRVDAALGGEVLTLACPDGLYSLRDGTWKQEGAPPGRVLQLAREHERWAAATSKGVFERVDGAWSQAAGAPPQAHGVTYDAAGALWVAAPNGLHRRTQPGSWHHLAGAQGLPWIAGRGPLASGPNGEVWLATDRGAVRWHPERGFSYRQGPRWLPGDAVHHVVVDDSGTAWIATGGGVARIAPERLTLAKKAAQFEAAIEARHRRTEYGFVESVRLGDPGDLSAWAQRDSDNDGLWTSMYGAGQCFAYAASGDPLHAERARAAFRALAFLSEVPQGSSHPPPPGFPARTVLPTSGPDPNPHYSAERDRLRRERDPLWKVLQPRWPVSDDGRWYWKTDTSSDELDGHFFFYAQFHDLVADEAERQEVARVVTAIVDHLSDHGWRLVDHDGRPTRWANFAPESLNHDPAWADETGLNSLSLLSYLAVAHHVSGDTRYAEHAQRLIREHGYARNVDTPKVHRGPGTGNQSDDEMAFMSFYTLLRYEQDPALRAAYLRAFRGYWELERPEGNPLFHFLYAGVAPQPPSGWLREARETLMRFPLERVEWSYTNSHRLDVVLHPVEPGEGRLRGQRRDGRVLPIDERFVGKWNTDPWQLDGHGDGRNLADGNAFLLPYYLGRHLGFLGH